MSEVVGRTAPSSTGLPHPGTVASVLLAWLHARHHGGRFLLRLEDLDRTRSRPSYVAALLQMFAWLGLDYDGVAQQSDHAARHHAALDGLAARDLLYRCSCARSRLRRLAGATGEVGTAAYDNHCRDQNKPLRQIEWPHAEGTVRLRLQQATGKLGDPIVRRADGSVGYALAAVVDDAAAGVTHVVRGQDLAVHAPLHAHIYACLNLTAPQWLHHPLLYGHGSGDTKLSKLHASVPIDVATADAGRLLGKLAYLLRLRDDARPVQARELLQDFAWERLPAAQEKLLWAP